MNVFVARRIGHTSCVPVAGVQWCVRSFWLAGWGLGGWLGACWVGVLLSGWLDGVWLAGWGLAGLGSGVWGGWCGERGQNWDGVGSFRKEEGQRHAGDG